MKRRLLLSVMGLAIAMMANAQEPFHVTKVAEPMQWATPEAQPIAAAQASAFHFATTRPTSATRRAARKAPSIITEEPAGTKKVYSLASTGYAYLYDNSTSAYQQQEQTGTRSVVFADDGKTVYMRNPIYGFPADAWVEGTISDDGTTLTFPLGQYIVYYEDDGYGLITVMADVTTDGTIAATVDQTATSVSYTIDDDTITLQGTSAERVYTVAWDDEMTAMTYGIPGGEYATQMTLFAEEAVAPPSGARTLNYTYITSIYHNEWIPIQRQVKLAGSGNDIYLQGITDIQPEAWIKGTYVNGTGYVFATGQFMGFGRNDQPLYLVGWVSNQPGDVIFVYDGENFTTNNSYLINGKKDQVYVYEQHVYSHVTQKVDALVTLPDGLTTVAGTLTGTNVADGSEVSRNLTLAFDGDDVYVQGLGYVNSTAWVKGTVGEESVTFNIPQLLGAYGAYPLTYFYVYNSSRTREAKLTLAHDTEAATMTQTDDFTVATSVKRNYPTTFERLSNIVISYEKDDPTGIEALSTEPVAATYYDLQGRQVSPSSQGILLRKTVGSDGKTRIEKILRR